MGTLRFWAALFIGKVSLFFLRVIHRRGTQLPGRLSLKLSPDFLKRIAKPAKIIVITGTNGKTTVVNLLSDVLRASGFSVMTNSAGSNLESGIASTWLAHTSPLASPKAQIAVLEVDERSTTKVLPKLQPDYLLCTNIFSDSVLRNGHPEFILSVIKAAIPDKTKLILNADDLLCSALGENREARYFGIGKQPNDSIIPTSLRRDILSCPSCAAELRYEFWRYHHIGKAYCPACGFVSEQADYLATEIGETQLTLNEFGETSEYPLVNDNLVNVYNEVAVIAASRELGLSEGDTAKALGMIHIDPTRFEIKEINGVKIIFQLAKGMNAVACSRAFDYLSHYRGKKAVILNLDDAFDKVDSSENICWIYDCDYEYLADESIAQIVVGGVRRHDQVARLLIAGVGKERIASSEDELKTADLIDLRDVDTIFICYDVYTVDVALQVRESLTKRLLANAAASAKEVA